MTTVMNRPKIIWLQNRQVIFFQVAFGDFLHRKTPFSWITNCSFLNHQISSPNSEEGSETFLAFDPNAIDRPLI
jgi:hypothetical protein